MLQSFHVIVMVIKQVLLLISLQGKQGNKEKLTKEQQKALKSKELYIQELTHVFRHKLKYKNHLINLTHGCLCSDFVDGYAMEIFFLCFCFGKTIDILRNRLLKFCCVHDTTGAAFLAFFCVNQSIFLRCLWLQQMLPSCF